MNAEQKAVMRAAAEREAAKLYPRLSAAQRDLLAALAGYSYRQGHVRPAARRTIQVLERRGLVRSIGQGWYEATDKGVAALNHERREG